MRGGTLEVKIELLGPDAGQQRQVRILNRLLTGAPGQGISYEADPGHVERIVADTDVQG